MKTIGNVYVTRLQLMKSVYKEKNVSPSQMLWRQFMTSMINMTSSHLKYFRFLVPFFVLSFSYIFPRYCVYDAAS